MKHFTFKKIGACILDSKKLGYEIEPPTNAIIGEFITVGNGSKHKILYIKTTDKSPEKSTEILNMFPEHENNSFMKIIQYCYKIEGFIFGYINWD